MKRTEPSRPATDQKAGFQYTPAKYTNVAERFAQVRQQLQEKNMTNEILIPCKTEEVKLLMTIYALSKRS